MKRNSAEERIIRLSSDGYHLDILHVTPTQIESRYLHIFIHGLSRDHCDEPPLFYRRSSASRTGGVNLHLSDPIFYSTSGCPVGWFLLQEEELYPQLTQLVDDLVAHHALDGVVWHGNSGGGYVALKYASRSIHKSLAFAVSPQNDITLMPQFLEYERASAALPTAPPIRAEDEMLLSEASYFLLVPEFDETHLQIHARRLLQVVPPNRLRVRVLRNGLGHGRMRQSDYWENLADALSWWQVREQALE